MQSSFVPNRSQLGRQPTWVLNQCFLCWRDSINWSPFCVNSCLRAWLTDYWLLLRSYINTTNRSRTSIQSSMASGVQAKAQKVIVTLLKVVHVSQAVFVSLLPNDETVSHSIKAWNIGKAMHRSGPSALDISWAGRCLKLQMQRQPIVHCFEGFGCCHCKY